MIHQVFNIALIGIAAIFTVIFCAVVVPPLIADPDIVSAILAGFDNPYASGYSTDVILCWVVLAIWVFYERHTYSVKHGWICVALGVVPGVAVGFPLYLVLRQKQLTHTSFAS